MPGLSDSTTGLTFGDNLQFQTAIGTDGLVINVGVAPVVTSQLLWGSDSLVWGGTYLTWGS